jgi:squalene-hopene/tetraprenyl-beta-curcumene cyclase
MQQLGQESTQFSEPSPTDGPADGPTPAGSRPAPRDLPGPAPSPDEQAPDFADLRAATAKARDHLLSLQRDDGHWCAELEGDSILESEYLLLLQFLGRSREPRARKAAEYVRRQQRPDGGWSIYPGGPADVSASVKAYFVLKLQGDDPDAPHMARARERILELGGVEATNTYTKTYLAIFGQYPWSGCPAIPPEIVLLPRWFYFDLYEMSSWSRTIFVPLSVVWAHKPSRPVPEEAGIQELFLRPDQRPKVWHVQNPGDDLTARERRWRTFFFLVDRCLKMLEATRFLPLRRKALRRAEAWVRERLVGSDGLGAIFPSIVNTVVAFHCLGYGPEDPAVARSLAALETMEIEDGETLRLQPCMSPVWDTAQAVSALVTTGVDAADPRLRKAVRWLLDKEVRTAGDWQLRLPDVEPGGWYFEYANEPYPDCDDTAEVLTALARVELDPDDARRGRETRHRGLRWLLAMQNDDGGWAAFDKGCTKEILTLVPFADHNAMIDPSCEDITGRTLETLALEGFERSDPVVAKAIRFLEDRQTPEGAWYGRWGCNYLYGTWLVLWGLGRIGVDLTRERYRRSVRWLESCQNPDGGWGESLRSYDEPELKGVGPSTASQTSWALMALMAAGETESRAVRRGVRYLLDTQLPDGSWDEKHWTGTGFPKVFYLRYHYYDDYFPLLALAEYLSRRRGSGETPLAGRSSPRLVSVHGG